MPDQPVPVPPDDLSRGLTVARPDEDPRLPHIGLVGDTYTILVVEPRTPAKLKYTLIDMHIPPGGGPPPHRHDFEEMFTVMVTERCGRRSEARPSSPGPGRPSTSLGQCAAFLHQRLGHAITAVVHVRTRRPGRVLYPGRPAGRHLD